MSVMFEWVCGEAMCKHRFNAALPGTPDPWPIICPRCNRSLYPDEILQRPQSDESLVPDRAELRAWSGGRSVECTADDLRRMRGEPGSSLVDQILASMEPVAPSPIKQASIKQAPAAPLAPIKKASWGKVALACAVIILGLLITLLLTRS